MAANKRRLAERFVMAPQETFDIDTLSEAMPVASWKQFEEVNKCRIHCVYFYVISVKFETNTPTPLLSWMGICSIWYTDLAPDFHCQ